MTETAPGCTLGDLLANDQLGLTVLADQPGARSRVLRGARLTSAKDSADTADDVVLVLAQRPRDGTEVAAELAGPLGLPGSRVIVAWLPDGGLPGPPALPTGAHVLLGLAAAADPGELIAEIARATVPVDGTPTQRLTSLQRSLTRALADPNPLQALTARTAKLCNAVVIILSSDGTTTHATGPLPLSLLLPEIARTDSESQKFAVQGWYGLAVRIAAGASGGEKNSWLVTASRRASFPDRYSEAAIYIAASLAETSLLIDLAAQQQERAVRSGVLEQLLAMRLERHDAELAGRVASLGISFDHEVRAISLEFAPHTSAARESKELDALYFLVERVLAAERIPHLLTLREGAVIGLAQASVPTIRRAFVKGGPTTAEYLLGVGRDAADTGHVVDSYHDAQLAVRVLRRDDTGHTSLSYEDFDFATRLFSTIGLDRMSEWADELLRPLDDQQILLDALAAYFECQQNIMDAAESLMIHHNSLRYRLAKIESALNLTMRDPSAVSSLFLALTARSMVQAESRAARSITPGTRTGRAGDARGAGAAGAVLSEAPGELSARFGAAIGPER